MATPDPGRTDRRASPAHAARPRVGRACTPSRSRPALLFVLPFVFVVLTALMSDQQSLTRDLWPHPFAVAQPGRRLAHARASRPGGATPSSTPSPAPSLTLVSSIPVAYALACFRFRGRNLAMMVVIATMMLPPQVVIVPMYLVWAKELHLSGTLWPLIIPLAFGDAFSIFLLRQFMLTVPREYLEAAKVDGCSDLQRAAARRAADDPAGHRRGRRCSSSSTAGTTTSGRRSTPARTRPPGRSATGCSRSRAPTTPTGT